MVSTDFLIYSKIECISLDLRSSAFVRTGTETIAILFLPACTIVSNVYVYSLCTFMRMAAFLL